MARRSAPALVAHVATAASRTQRHPDRRRVPATRWPSTPRSAAARTCCCTSRRSPSTPGCGGRRSTTGPHVNRQVPRLVDALPNGPVGHPTVRVFLAGGVPEVMLHLRDLGLLELDALTVSRRAARRRSSTGGRSPSAARGSATCSQTRDQRRPGHGHHVARTRRRQRGLTSTVTFPRGNLAPEGSRHQIDGDRPDGGGRRRRVPQDGPAKVFTTERAAIAAIKGEGAEARSSRATCWCCAAAGRWASGWRRRTRSRRR